MALIPIGAAAAKLGVTTATLRYYEERGLVPPAERRAGRRMYGPAELRRLALARLLHRLGIPLATAAAILDEPGESWRVAVRRQVAELDTLIARAQGARAFLTGALTCPSPDPTRECPDLLRTLDDLVAGKPFEQLVTERPQPPDRAARPGPA